MSFQEHVLLSFATSVAEYESVIHVWRQKAEHDLVRPVTVIKQWDDDVLNTFGGNRSVDGPVDIVAREFESFYPLIEPSPEFPSLGACFCEVLMEFYDLY